MANIKQQEENFKQYCSKCLYCCSKEIITENLVTIPEKENVFQCPNCFYPHETITIWNNDDNCIICFEKSKDKLVYICSHWICESCHFKNRKKEICPYCKQESPNTAFIQNTDVIFEFPNQVKKYFKKLFISIYFELNSYDLSKNENLILNYYVSKQLLEEYYKWLLLLNEYGGAKKLSPSLTIDRVWHSHILITSNYRKVCNFITKDSNKFLDHYPENSFLTKDEKRLQRYNYTLECYNKKFGVLDYNKKLFWSEYNPVLLKYYKENIGEIIISYNTRLYRIPLTKTMTVYNVKEIIEKIKGFPTSQQRIIFAGIQLEDGRRLVEDYSVLSNSTLFLILALKGC